MTARMMLGSGLLGLVLTSLLSAAPPIENLLPATTTEYIQVVTVGSLESAWEKTHLARLFGDPALKEFRASLGTGVWMPGEIPARLSLTPQTVRALAGGHAGWGYVQSEPGYGAQILWIDTTGRAEELKAWLAACAGQVKKAGGTVVSEKFAGWPVTVYDTVNGSVYGAVREELLLLCESREVLEAMLRRWATGAESLARVPAFQAVQKRLGHSATKADLRLYLDPIGRAEILRGALPPASKGRDPLAVLKKQGVDGVRGIGAAVRIADGTYDLLYRIVIHAPPPLRGGLGVIRLTPGTAFEPEAWVPAKLASYTTFHVDLGAVFNGFAPLFDQFAPGGKDGAFKDLLDKLKNDPVGPQVDLRKELIDRLQSRITVYNAPSDPNEPRGDRLLLIIPSNDAVGLKKTLRRMFEGDEGQGVTRHVLAQNEAWVVEPLTRKKGPDGQPIKAGHTAFCVANGNLCICNRLELLEEMLRGGVKEGPLSEDVDYKRVAAAFERLVPTGARVALHDFSRPDQDYRAVYEQARQRRLGESGSLHANLASLLLVTRLLPGDPVRLPPFATVAPFLRPTGTLGLVHDDGWEVIGFTLAK